VGLNKTNDKMNRIIKKLLLTPVFLICCLLCTAQQKEVYKVKVNVLYELAKPGDTLVLRFSPHILMGSQQIKIVDRNGACTFDLAQPYSFGMISIEKYKPHPSWKNDSRMVLYNLYWEKDDDITIRIQDSKKINDYASKTTFSGKGAEKYRLQYELRAAMKNLNRAYPVVQTYNDPMTDTIFYNRPVMDSLYALLEQHTEKLSPFMYQVLKADIHFSSYLPFSEQLQNVHLNSYQTRDQLTKQRLVRQVYNACKFEGFTIPDSAMAHAYNFQKMVRSIFYSNACLKFGKPTVKELIEETNAHLNGISKQSALLASIIYLGLDTHKNSDILLDSDIKYAPFNLLLHQYLSKRSKKVYNYRFLDTTGRDIDLAQYKGKFLLIDFWFSGCGGCAVYYQQTLKLIEEEFKGNKRLAIISISSDKQFEKWKKSIPMDLYTNSYAINLNAGPIGNNHKFYQDFGIFKNPLIILVDPDGNIIEFDTENIRTTKELLSATLKKYIQ